MRRNPTGTLPCVTGYGATERHHRYARRLGFLLWISLIAVLLGIGAR